MSRIAKPKINRSFYVSQEFEHNYKWLAGEFRKRLSHDEYGKISDADVLNACIGYCADLVRLDPDVIDAIVE